MSRELDVVTLTGAEYDAMLLDADRYRLIRKYHDGGSDFTYVCGASIPLDAYIDKIRELQKGEGK